MRVRKFKNEEINAGDIVVFAPHSKLMKVRKYKLKKALNKTLKDKSITPNTVVGTFQGYDKDGNAIINLDLDSEFFKKTLNNLIEEDKQ